VEAEVKMIITRMIMIVTVIDITDISNLMSSMEIMGRTVTENSSN